MLEKCWLDQALLFVYDLFERAVALYLFFFFLLLRSFKAEVFLAEGCKDRADYDNKYGADLWKEDIEQYDKVCKVEPFQRGLKTLNTDCMINGRTRWQV